MKYIIPIVMAVCFCLKTVAQTNLDSIWNVWQDQTQTDSVRLLALKQFTLQGYMFSQPDSAFYFSQLLHDFAQKQGMKLQMAEALNMQGASYHFRGDYSMAVEYYQKGLALDEEIGNKRGIARELNSIGTILIDQGNYAKALEYNLRSLVVKEELGNKDQIATSLVNIGNIYSIQGDQTKALEYYERAHSIFEELGDKSGIAHSLVNIGLIYSNQKDLPKALEYINKSQKMREELDDNLGIANTMEYIGSIFNEQENHIEALKTYQESLELHRELENEAGIASALMHIGFTYHLQDDHTKAIENCLQSLEIATKMADLHNQKESCQCLHYAYKAAGKNTEALKYHEQLVMLKDSLFNDENTKRLTRLEMQYDFDKKEAATKAEQEKKDALTAQELKRQRLVRNGFIGGFVVVLLFAGVFFLQRNRISKEKERSEELLLNILPEEVAEELKEKGHSDAQLIDHVTVLFTDFKGFTALSEKVTPKELVADLHECFSAFDNICEKYGIEKIKTIGDAYMAAGGLPSPNTTHAQDVVNSALEMAQAIEKGKAKKIAAGLPFFEIRIGVHTGPVVAGIVGVKKFQYDIWGDTVNTASRMESSGEVGKVNISQTTYELVKDQFACEFRGEVAAKGKGEMKMYFVSRNG